MAAAQAHATSSSWRSRAHASRRARRPPAAACALLRSRASLRLAAPRSTSPPLGQARSSATPPMPA
eukprot:6620015-Lingulodinium_polyedra.AAC.1